MLSTLLSRRLPYALFAGPFLGVMLVISAQVQAEPASPSQPQPVYPSATEAPGSSAQSAPEAAAPESAPAREEAESQAEPAKPKSNIVINVDKQSQHMTVFVDGIEQYAWPVSTGIRGYSTPSGAYSVSSMNEIWYSKEWDNAAMPHAIFFTKRGHAIHGTQEVKRLGGPASKGCVRLAPKNAKTLFTLVKQTGMENVKVVLEGETPGGEAKIAGTAPSQRYPDQTQPWFVPGQPYADGRRWRRGLFGRAQPYYGTQGYYQAPPPKQRYRRRGY